MGSEGIEEHGGESIPHCREHMYHHEQNVRNMKIKDALVKNRNIFICLLVRLFIFAFGREKNRMINSALFIFLLKNKYRVFVFFFVCVYSCVSF